jgi:hypothetical protein
MREAFCEESGTLLTNNKLIRFAASLNRPYTPCKMTRQQILDLYFIETRAKLIDVAAFLDRAQRAKGQDDFRLKAFRAALGQLRSSKPDRARRVLRSLSDPTSKPVAAAGTKGASGAWAGISSKAK